MNETRESSIFEKIRLLLDQLEASSNNNAIEIPDCFHDNMLEKMLRMSCDRFWIYDPSINMVEIYLTHPKEGKPDKVTRSLSSLLSRVDAGNRRKVASAFDRLLHQTSTEESFEYFETKDDRTIGYNVTACFCDKQDHLRVVGVSHIITEIQQSVDQVMQAQKKFELLMGLSSMYVWEYDVKKKKFFANKSLCEKLNIEQRPYSIGELESVVQVNELPEFFKEIEHKEIGGKANVHIKALNNNGTQYIFKTDFMPIEDRYDGYALLLGTMSDITESEMLKTMASKDSLTGCYNRNMADITLESYFKNFMENGDSYTIIFFDIDKFKSVNDRYGHDMGDYVLSSICAKISKEIRSNDMMFRWGGDEFLLICQGIAKENIYGYIDRLRKNIEFSSFEFNGTKLQLTISIGAAIFYKNDLNYNAAMKRADRSLYKAKLAGRNKVAILK